MAVRIPALAVWFLALGVLAVVRMAVRVARVGWTGSAVDFMWVIGGALLLMLGATMAWRARGAGASGSSSRMRR